MRPQIRAVAFWGGRLIGGIHRVYKRSAKLGPQEETKAHTCDPIVVWLARNCEASEFGLRGLRLGFGV